MKSLKEKKSDYFNVYFHFNFSIYLIREILYKFWYHKITYIYSNICSLKQVYNHQMTTIQNYVNVYDYYRPVSGTAPCKLATVLNVRYCKMDCDEAA